MISYERQRDPSRDHRLFGRLEYPRDPQVEAVIVLAIDDMRIDSVPKYGAFMRPLIDRLKKSRGRAPVSIMTCTADPTEPQFQTWIGEGLNLDVHTTRHPCACPAGLAWLAEPRAPDPSPSLSNP